jgi:exonuclease III
MEFGCGMYGVNCYNIPVRISRRNKVLPKFISGKKANLNNCIQISTLNESPVLHTNETIVTHNNVKPIPVRISSRRRHTVRAYNKRVYNKQIPRNLVNVNITKGSRNNSSLINNETTGYGNIPSAREQQHLTLKNSLIFSNVNARSLKNKTEVFIDHIIENKIDICVVTETWLKDDDSVALAALSSHGYSFRNIPRTGERTGGGTGIMVRENFKIGFIEGIQRLSFEVSEWNLTANGHISKFVIVYRPPYSDVHPVTISTFFEEFTIYLEGLVMCSEVLIIAGDFNIHMDDLAHVDTCRFSELLETFGLVQHVNFATHRSGHWLDLIITRSSNDVMVASPRPSLFLSDHCFAECVLAISSPGAIVKDVCFRKFSGIDFSAFRADITSSNLSELPDKDLAANYDSTLRAILEKHAPVQYKVKVVRPRVPWFNNDLMRLKARRRKLEKKMRKTNNVSDISTYRNVCNEYCLLLKNTKTTYYSDMIEHCAGDSKRLFQVVRSLCKERSDNLLPHSDHPRQLANEFGEYFCRKISLIREKIASCDSTPPDLSIPSPSIRLDKFIQVSEVEVRNIIMSSSNASCHLDPFPTWLVKKCVDQLAPLITKMINSSLESGTVPENWKVALIVPILKKFGLDLVFMNFRPISNLPFVSKTAEKVVASQILDHCSAHAPLAACQSSYRKHHSTETALLKVQSDILLSMDRQEVTLLVLLDLSAAFDTIDHDIMINLLENDFGITDQALSWLKSFLSGRKQRVVIGQQQSEDFDLISGVPQGSCLGPLLFIMYTSQLFHLVKKHLPTAHGYADDTKLYLSFRPISTVSQDHAIQAMEDCISDIHNWTTHHRLMMNDDKTEFLIIGSRQQLAKINISNVHVGSSEILPVNSVRDLGAWLDETMSMDVHIGKICSKAFRGLYKIRQIRKFLSEESTKTLIHAFVTVHLDYCNSLLSGVPQRQMDRLQKVFNAAARVVYYIPRYAHITPVLMRLHWLPISYRIKFKIALLVFKALKDMAPTYIRELLELKPLSRYALRSDTQNLLKVPRTKCKTFGDRAFAVAGPRVWNQLPLDIRTSATVDTFKNRLKTYFYKLAFL